MPTRGALRDRHGRWVRDAVDAAASGEQVRAGRMMPTRTAKSCRSDAPEPASSLREEASATVSTKHGHREEHKVSRKTIAQGRPGLLRCTCGDYARVSISLHTRLRVHWAPGFPCALCSQSDKRTCKTRAKSRRGMAESYLKFEPRHCEERSDANRHCERSNPFRRAMEEWIASSRGLSSGAHLRRNTPSRHRPA